MTGFRKARTDLLEKVLEDLGFVGATRSWPFTEDGHRKIAHIHAKDIYEIINVLDWDELQHGEG